MVGEIAGNQESEWAAMGEVARLLGIGTPETVGLGGGGHGELVAGAEQDPQRFTVAIGSSPQPPACKHPRDTAVGRERRI
jgi:hypothetical protein